LVACVAIHERIVVGPGLALIARCLVAGGIVAALWVALRAAARALRCVRRLRGARTLVLGCLLEAIIERVIQRIELVVSCAGRRLLCALAAGIGPRRLLDVPVVEVMVDRVEIILGICRVARARSVLVLHATNARERILSIPVAVVPVARGERILSISVAAVPVTRGERILSIPVACGLIRERILSIPLAHVLAARRGIGERILSIPMAFVPVARGCSGERILSIPVAQCVVESIHLPELGRHLSGVSGVQLVLLIFLGPRASQLLGWLIIELAFHRVLLDASSGHLLVLVFLGVLTPHAACFAIPERVEGLGLSGALNTAGLPIIIVERVMRAVLACDAAL
jgi:hypothetical protein